MRKRLPEAQSGRTRTRTLCPGGRGNGALHLGGVTFQWDARKALANLKKHGVTFEDASSVFFDPLAITYPDPDHSLDERREVTLGYTIKGDMVFVSASVGTGFGSLARALQHGPNEGNMKKESAAKRGDRMRKEYDLSKLTGGVRGRYYRRATAGTNLVLIEPDLASMFPDSEAVNRALRVLAEAAQAAGVSKGRRSR